MATTPVLVRRRRWLLPALGVATVGAAVALAAFQPWKAFVDDTVEEAAPIAAVAPTTATNAATIAAAQAATTAAPATTATTATTLAPTTAPAAVPTTAAASPPASPVTPPSAATAAPAAPVAPTPTPATTAAPVATTAAPAPPVEPAPTAFVSKAHDTSGTVRLLTLDDGSRVLRIENLDTSNGPDVKVVLSPDPNGYADGAVSLGTLKGNKGSQNYAIPAGVDPASFRSVVVWCKRFDVDFGVAPLPA
jgi:hypothetical protein